jgi:hypothetical protein
MNAVIRTQVQLSPEQAAVIKRLASERGVSMAEIIRQSIDAFVGVAHRPAPDELRRRARGIAGMIPEGPTDMSIRHDDYLAEAYEQ